LGTSDQGVALKLLGAGEKEKLDPSGLVSTIFPSVEPVKTSESPLAKVNVVFLPSKPDDDVRSQKLMSLLFGGITVTRTFAPLIPSSAARKNYCKAGVRPSTGQ
jgi:hypothetical protein